MFKSISWQDFLTGIAAILGAYYVVSILLLYSRDVIRLVNTKRKSTEDPEISSPRSTSNVMGSIKSDLPRRNEQAIEAQDLIIGEPVNNTNQNEDSLLVGTVSDLLRETKVLTRVIKENGGSKNEGVPMFQSLLSNYSQLIDSKYLESISVFIHHHCLDEGVFDVDLNEIRSWWPQTESQNNQK